RRRRQSDPGEGALRGLPPNHRQLELRPADHLVQRVPAADGAEQTLPAAQPMTPEYPPLPLHEIQGIILRGYNLDAVRHFVVRGTAASSKEPSPGRRTWATPGRAAPRAGPAG